MNLTDADREFLAKTLTLDVPRSVRPFIRPGRSSDHWVCVIVVPRAYASRMAVIAEQKLEQLSPLEWDLDTTHGRRYGYVVVEAELDYQKPSSEFESECKGLQRACVAARSEFRGFVDYCDLFSLRGFIVHDRARAATLFGERVVRSLLGSQ